MRTAALCMLAGSVAFGQTSDETSVNPELLRGMLTDDVRLLVIGDSFSAPRFDRVIPAGLRVWPIKEYSGIAGGCQQWGLLVCDVLGQPAEQVSAATTYEVLRQSPEVEYFALPIRFLHELYLGADAQLEGGFMYHTALNNSKFSVGELGRFTNAGDRLKYRMLYWAPPSLSQMLQIVTLWDGPTKRATINIRQSSRQLWSQGGDPSTGEGVFASPGQINATSVDVDVLSEMDGEPGAIVGEKENAVGSDTYLEFAGGVYYKVDDKGDRVPGLYYTYLADDSWSYTGFGADKPSMGPLDKTYSIEQLTHWLDVTTLDRDQPLIVIYYIEAEAANKTELKSRMTKILDQTQAACDAVGISSVTQCFIIPHTHRYDVVPEGEWKAQMAVNRNAAYELANERENLAALSLFDATDGTLFNGSNEAKSWLLEHGYDNFTYGDVTVDLVNGPLGGDLLGGGNLHPADDDAAAFFASVIGELLISDADCNADGAVDVLDFVCFQNAWLHQEPFGDCDADGNFDILDFVCYQTIFQQSCP